MNASSDPLDSDLPFILGDAEGEEAQLRALWNASAAIVLPLEARVRGEPVEVFALTRSETMRGGIMAKVRDAARSAGEPAEIGIEEVEFGESTIARRWVAAYRHWLDRKPGGEVRRQFEP